MAKKKINKKVNKKITKKVTKKINKKNNYKDDGKNIFNINVNSNNQKTGGVGGAGKAKAMPKTTSGTFVPPAPMINSNPPGKVDDIKNGTLPLLLEYNNDKLTNRLLSYVDQKN